MKTGDIVYLLSGDDCRPRIIRGELSRGGSTQYEIVCGIEEPTWHFDYEITTDKKKINKGVFEVKGLKK